ncbi:MAG: hypothetical protein L0Z50_20950 [Verrucomicrobiales bacterium]|nr:hypothetical protein [Verrucomicrobiales bacterium]
MTPNAYTPGSLTSERDEDQRVLDEKRQARERFGEGPPKSMPSVRHTMTASQDFARLGKWLARLEQEFRMWHEGTAEQQLICEVSHSPQTHNLARTCQRIAGILSKRAFREAEIHKEKCFDDDK